MQFIEEDLYKNKIGIYKITNIKNNKVYIGQTKDRFIERYWSHVWRLKNNSHNNQHLQKSWNKYGENSFLFEVIEICDDILKIDQLEIDYIRKHKDFGNCYNITDGGKGSYGYIMSESQRKSIGDKNRKNMLGKKHSEITKAKMSQARKGRVYNRINLVIDFDTAIKIKKDLIHNIPYKDIYKKYNVCYKTINGIISNNTWKSAKVDGWNEFLLSKPQKLNYETAEIIRNKFNNGVSKDELMAEYKKSERTIRDIIKNNIYTQ